MATCAGCGLTHFGMLELKAGFCKTCREQLAAEEQAKPKKKVPAIGDHDLERIILTTETSSDLKITQRLGIVSAECAFGMHMLKDAKAGLQNVFGGRSDILQKTLRDSRNVALRELKNEAFQLNADAVIGVSLNYVELANAGTMVLLVATGTAVKLAD